MNVSVRVLIFSWFLGSCDILQPELTKLKWSGILRNVFTFTQSHEGLQIVIYLFFWGTWQKFWSSSVKIFLSRKTNKEMPQSYINSYVWYILPWHFWVKNQIIVTDNSWFWKRAWLSASLAETVMWTHVMSYRGSNSESLRVLFGTQNHLLFFTLSLSHSSRPRPWDSVLEVLCDLV